jgi:putative transposase
MKTHLGDTRESKAHWPMWDIRSDGELSPIYSEEHGIEPAPERDKHTSWSTFPKAHWECLTATDFLSIEVCTLRGLVKHYVLFFINIASRSVHSAGMTPHPDNPWMMQVARNITDFDDGFLRRKRYLLLDRDAKYSDEFRNFLAREGIHVIRLPPRSPNLNAFAERFVRSIKEECLSRMIFFGQASLRHAIREFMAHYHGERNHQGLDNQLLRPLAADRKITASVSRRQRLGGILSYYHRQVA